MSSDDEKEIIVEIRAARVKARGYADFFGWATDRELEEWGVVSSLSESLQTDNALFFSNLKRRGRSNDPPDCEAQTGNGERIAIEVTELVDGQAIQAFKEGRVYDWEEWTKEKFHSVLTDRISKKDKCFPKLKESPYIGGYIVVVHTDEPELSRTVVEGFLAELMLEKPKHIDRAFLILSYDPAIGHCPYFELNVYGQQHHQRGQ
jgi:hypothetical protein